MKKIILIIFIILIAIQFIPVDKTNPPLNSDKDFIYLTNPPKNIENMLRSSCYDCHSNETKYPWYSNIAPVSWLIKEHVNNGRRNVNFSIWSNYKEAKQDHKIEECIDMIKSGEMPMKAYVLFHKESELDEIKRKEIVDWLNSQIKPLNHDDQSP